MRPLKRAVVVDDNRISRMILRDMLRGYGADVVEAADGDRAFELILEHQPELVISDVLMPRCDGFALASRINQQEMSQPPVLFLTSAVYKSAHWKHEILTTYHADAFLPKPIDPQTLDRTLRRHFEIASS